MGQPVQELFFVIMCVSECIIHLIAYVPITHEEALFHFNLAPLETRRDIAQSIVINRVALRQGLNHFNRVVLRAPSCVGHLMHTFDPYAGCRHLYIRTPMFGPIGFHWVLRYAERTSN